MTLPDNPFPPQAVAVYGPEIATTAVFSYMDRVRKALQGYIADYPDLSLALALSGGHGSGKTHLLMWLSREIEAIRRGGTQIIYIKTDGSDPADLYRQVMRGLTREILLRMQREALVELGARRAGSVQATQADARNIRDFESLSTAVADKIVDLNSLHIELRNALVEAMSESAADVVRRAAAAIGLLEDPEFGESAFNWLCGDAVSGLPNTSLATGLFQSSAATDDIAIFALETVAALFRLAGRPLIILIDQVENLLTFDHVPKKSSNLKKLVEQLGNQRAAVVMAGTPAGWERMPRDVGPRLLDRAPWVIAGFTLSEAGELLEARLDVAQYTRGTIAPDAVETIHELSGGNAREILRIAYQAFVIADGDFTKFDRALLTQAAISSGTLDDRRVFAGQMIDDVARAEHLDIAPGEKPVYGEIRVPGGAVLRIVIAVAADATAEAMFARKLAQTLQDRDRSESIQILVISVGYSSARVAELLKGVSDIVVFDETRLKKELRDRFRKLKAALPVAADPEGSAQLDARLAQLDGVLSEIQKARADSERKIARLLAERTAAAAAPEREASEARTRYELRDGLDTLGEALAARKLEGERKAIRRLLIANEVNVRDSSFDYLGSLYLDALDLERGDAAQRRQTRIERPADPIKDLRHLRADTILAMRKLLSQQATLTGARGSQASLAAIAGLSLSVFTFLIVAFRRYSNAYDYYSRHSEYGPPIAEPKFEDYLTGINVESILFPLVVGTLLGILIYLGFELRTRPNIRYRWIRTALDGIRAKLRAYEDDETTAPKRKIPVLYVPKRKSAPPPAPPGA